MKKILTKFLAFSSIALLMLASCKKNDPIIKTNGGTAGTLSANSTTVTLAKSSYTDTATVVRFTFTKPAYGFSAAVTNTLQIDSAGDNWKKPMSVTLGTNILSQGYNTADFNSLLLKLNLAAGVASQVNVRIEHSVSWPKAGRLPRGPCRLPRRVLPGGRDRRPGAAARPLALVGHRRPADRAGARRRSRGRAPSPRRAGAPPLVRHHLRLPPHRRLGGDARSPPRGGRQPLPLARLQRQPGAAPAPRPPLRRWSARRLPYPAPPLARHARRGTPEKIAWRLAYAAGAPRQGAAGRALRAAGRGGAGPHAGAAGGASGSPQEAEPQPAPTAAPAVLSRGEFYRRRRFGPETVNRGAVLMGCEWDGGRFEDGARSAASSAAASSPAAPSGAASSSPAASAAAAGRGASTAPGPTTRPRTSPRTRGR